MSAGVEGQHWQYSYPMKICNPDDVISCVSLTVCYFKTPYLNLTVRRVCNCNQLIYCAQKILFLSRVSIYCNNIYSKHESFVTDLIFSAICFGNLLKTRQLRTSNAPNHHSYA